MERKSPFIFQPASLLVYSVVSQQNRYWLRCHGLKVVALTPMVPPSGHGDLAGKGLPASYGRPSKACLALNGIGFWAYY